MVVGASYQGGPVRPRPEGAGAPAADLLWLTIPALALVSSGQSGTGRTTFVNTLCEQPVISHKPKVQPEEAHLETGIRINPVTVGKQCLRRESRAFSADTVVHLQSSRRMACASRSPSSTRPALAIRSTTISRGSSPLLLRCRLQSDLADLSTHSFAEISGYIERQYDEALGEESRIKRNPRFRDNRVHAVLYFITPTGHA